MTKLAICGSRDLFVSKSAIGSFIDNIAYEIEKWMLIEIVSGGADGIDACAQNYSDYMHIRYKEFPADWELYGKRAGPIRNKQIAVYSDCLLLIWDGESKGSLNCKNEFLKLNKPIYEVVITKHNIGA